SNLPLREPHHIPAGARSVLVSYGPGFLFLEQEKRQEESREDAKARRLHGAFEERRATGLQPVWHARRRFPTGGAVPSTKATLPNPTDAEQSGAKGRTIDREREFLARPSILLWRTTCAHLLHALFPAGRPCGLSWRHCWSHSCPW